MTEEEYLTTLKDQIRDRHAKEFVAEEYKTHIDEQTIDYLEKGMSKQEAEAAAVKDMGDPVSVGIHLDRIHRPKMEYKLLIMIALISIIGTILSIMINKNDPLKTTAAAGLISLSGEIIIMLIFYRIDYTIIEGKCRILCFILPLFVLLLAALFGNTMTGGVILNFVWPTDSILLFYIPLFAGILYEYREKGMKSLFQILFWAVWPLSLFLLRLITLRFAVLFLITELCLFYIALMKDWYKVKKGPVFLFSNLFFFLICGIGLSLTLTSNLNGSSKNQVMRVKNYLAHFGSGEYINDYHGNHLIYPVIAKVVSNCKWIGKSEAALNTLNSESNNYMFSDLLKIAAEIGLLFMFLSVLLLFALAGYVFVISFRQKNRLGFILGCSCAVVFFFHTLSITLISLGVLPLATTSVPIISMALPYNIFYYSMLGIMLSVYRYKDIRIEKRRSTIQFFKKLNT